MDPTLANLVRDAQAAMARGDAVRARQAWQAVLAREPRHVGALSALAAIAFRAGDLAAAEDALARALAPRPADPVLLRNLGAVRAAAGRVDAAAEALRAAAAADPGSCLPLLELAVVFAEAGRSDDAVRAGRAAWAVEPRLPDPVAADALPAPIPELARRVRRIGREWLAARCDAVFGAVRARHGNDVDLARIEAALRVYQGYAPERYSHPLQRARTLYLPTLDARAWFERAEFDWVPAIEAATPDIRAELLAVVAEGGGTEPYLATAPEPGAEWDALAGHDAWNSFFLYKKAARVPENCARCPRTEAAVLAVPTARSHGVPGEAFFSMLKPRTRIPPHHGYTNTKLVVHLPLVIPPGGHLKAGEVARTWTEGECLIFDDSFLHEAWNGSDRMRAVLIFEVWHPGLRPHEQDAVGGVLDAIADIDRL